MCRLVCLLLFGCLASAGMLIGFLAGVAIPPAPLPFDHSALPEPDSLPGRWALLVGVTRYDHLPASQHLAGPGNDVKAMREVLTTRFRFPAEHIRTLSEDEGPRKRPTRGNIVRAFEHLIEQVEAGDQVVVYLAGHGDRQPEADPPHSQYPEPDGIDEVFLPADVQGWDAKAKRLPNAIVDDEIGDWLEALTRKQVFVWAIFDCCHAGHMMRGSEVVRQLPPGTLVPAEALARARTLAAKRKPMRGSAGKPTPFLPRRPSEYLVALYACLPHETTTECLFPADAVPGRYHGLLTWMLVEALEQSASSPTPLTYRELVQRLQMRYAGRPGGGPTPALEGGGQDHVVLGTDRPVRPRLTLRRYEDGYRVDAGSLHGLTPGSVLAVFSPSGETAAPDLLGHVRVRSVQPFDATVQPCAHAGHPPPHRLPALAACRIVYTDYGLRRFKLAVQAGKGQEKNIPLVRKALRRLANAETGLVQWVDEGRTAEWLVRLEGRTVELVESCAARPPFALPPVDSNSFARELCGAVEKVYRARNLIRVAAHLERATAGASKGGIDLAVEVVCNGKVRPEPPGGWVFRPGNEVSCRVKNTSSQRINVHLLVVGPDFQIQAMYPGIDEVGKALEPGQVLPTEAGGIQPPFGREYVIAIATPARKKPIDFNALVQPGLNQRGYGEQAPLAQLLERAMYRVGTRGGLAAAELEKQAVRVLTWRTEARSSTPRDQAGE